MNNLRLQEKAKDRKELPMRATMMMKRKTDDYNKEEVKKRETRWNEWERREMMKKKWKLDFPMNPCQWKIDDDDTMLNDILNHCIIMPWELKVQK